MTPLLNIGNGYNSKKVVTFDTEDRLDDKIDKLTSMTSKLTAQGNNKNKQFKPKIYQGKRRGQTRNSYDQDNFHDRYRSNSGDRRMSFGGRAQYGQNYRRRSQYVDNYRNYFRTGHFRAMHIIEVRIIEVDIETI